MESRDTDTRLLELQAVICQALSDPKRLGILYMLAKQERPVGFLAQELEVSMANASQHLAVLKACGLVLSRKEGNSVLYRLAHPEIMEACRALRVVLSRQLANEGRLSIALSRLETDEGTKHHAEPASA